MMLLINLTGFSSFDIWLLLDVEIDDDDLVYWSPWSVFVSHKRSWLLFGTPGDQVVVNIFEFVEGLFLSVFSLIYW